MLAHRGRSTGLTRYVVLEIVDRPSPDSVVVAAGFGTKAQWYRNVQADPEVQVWLGSHAPRAAHATLLTPEECESVLDEYARRNPRSWATLKPVLDELLAEAPEGTTPPLVRFDLTD